MAYTTYLLEGGAFATMDTDPPSEFIRAWAVADEQAEHIKAGAELRVEGDELIVIPLPVFLDEPVTEAPPEDET